MKVITRKEKRKLSLTRQDTITILISILGLFLGRVAVFGLLNPVAIAFLSTYILRGYRLYLGAIFVTIGILTRFGGEYFFKYVAAVLIVVVTHFALENTGGRITKVLRAIVSSVAVLIPGLVLTVFLGRNTYYIAMSFIEAMLAFGLVFLIEKGIHVLEGRHIELDTESLLSCAIVLGAVVAGTSDIYIAGLSLKHFISSLIVLIVSHKGGATTGATAGIILGLMLTITHSSYTSFIGILSVAGMISGMGKNIATNIAGFVLGFLVTAVYLNIYIINFNLFFSIALASAIFAFGPKNVIIINKKEDPSTEYIEKSKEYMSRRLSSFSSSFNKLSRTFANKKIKHQLSEDTMSPLIDRVANTTCMYCTKRDTCWGTNFYATYQNFFALVGSCERQGQIVKIPSQMNDFCINSQTLISNVNSTYELHRNNMNWQNKVFEAKDIISQQLRGIGDILTSLSIDINNQLNFATHMEKAILQELAINKIEVQGVIVVENSKGKYEIDIKYKGPRKTVVKIIDVIKKVTGRNIIEDVQTNKNQIRLIEDQQFIISTGLAKSPKTEGLNSGDSYSAMHINGKKCLLVLSDGMGSGRRAKEESESTIQIFENFLETGFEKEIAIRIINSALVLQNKEDTFSTLDVCLLDMYSGVAEFTKMGAACTYIKRNNIVQTIKSSSLPMGILTDINVETTKKRLKHGDIVIMVTDGITESLQTNDKEDELIQLLENIELKSSQDIANEILENAKNSQQEIRDDMTVMVAKIIEK